MTADEHVPSDARMREQYIWAHAREAEGVAEQSYGIQVCGEAWDAWLTAHDARVRRDAAREALDGLASDALRTASNEDVQRDDTWANDARLVARSATEYRDTHYPEVTP